MSTRLPVSPEYDGTGHVPGESMRAAIERRVSREGVGPYLLRATRVARDTDAFDDVHQVKEAIDRSHGYRDRYGSLFLDGGVLAIDWLCTYAPQIVPRLHPTIEAFEREQNEQYLGGYATEEDELSYVTALRHWGNEARVAFANDHARVIADVAAWRGFSDKDTYRQLVITQGAGYVMKAAEEAYDTDMDMFIKDMLRSLVPRNQTGFAVADTLIDEAARWQAESRDQAA